MCPRCVPYHITVAIKIKSWNQESYTQDLLSVVCFYSFSILQFSYLHSLMVSLFFFGDTKTFKIARHAKRWLGLSSAQESGRLQTPW